MNKKYPIISDKKLMNKWIVIFPTVVLLPLIIISVFLGNIGLVIIFLPILVIVLIVMSLQYLIYKASGGAYLELTDEEIRIHRTIGKIPPYISVKYDQIKSITVNKNTLKSMDTGALTLYPVYAQMDINSGFFEEFAKLYKNKTGKDLVINK